MRTWIAILASVVVVAIAADAPLPAPKLVSARRTGNSVRVEWTQAHPLQVEAFKVEVAFLGLTNTYTLSGCKRMTKLIAAKDEGTFVWETTDLATNITHSIAVRALLEHGESEASNTAIITP